MKNGNWKIKNGKHRAGFILPMNLFVIDCRKAPEPIGQ